MTIKEVGYIIKRYRHIKPYVKDKAENAVYYSGNRKHVIPITDKVIAVCEIIDEIYVRVDEDWVRNLIKGLLSYKTDVKQIIDLPYEKNAFYDRKKQFVNLVYQCCIARGFVSYEEILSQKIF